jgi:hypothetical protein
VSWTYAYAFNAGDGHERCDDVCVCETLGDYILAAVADGAGSADKARAGAAIACQCFIELGVQIFSDTLEPSCLLAAIQEKIPEGESESHSCTFVGAIAGPSGAMILQVGDGAAVVRGSDSDEEPYSVPLWPEETEFLNHTFFITAPDAEEHLKIHRIESPIREFALFTDGLQHLVIDRNTKSPHQPFFKTIFRPLAAVPEHDVRTSWWLERQLASDHVTKRSDDDTSIVIARRTLC